MTASPARRDWLAKCVQGDPEIHIVGTTATFPSLRSLMTETAADLALIELQRDSQSEATRDWLDELLDLTPIVLLIPEPSLPTFNLIRRAGTGAILRPNASAEQIVQSIKGVASGLMIFDSALAPPSPDDEPLTERLTPREIEVLQLLADGLGNKEIGARLNISEHTIKFHIRSILGKLGAASRTEAVTRGLRSGLIEL